MDNTTTIDKPKCKLVGANGNVFNLIALASLALKRAGFRDKADEMSKKCFSAESYDNVLCIIMDYVDVE